MPLDLEAIDHLQVTVPCSVEAEALRFDDDVLGLKRIAKPLELDRIEIAQRVVPVRDLTPRGEGSDGAERP